MPPCTCSLVHPQGIYASLTLLNSLLNLLTLFNLLLGYPLSRHLAEFYNLFTSSRLLASYSSLHQARWLHISHSKNCFLYLHFLLAYFGNVYMTLHHLIGEFVIAPLLLSFSTLTYRLRFRYIRNCFRFSVPLLVQSIYLMFLHLSYREVFLLFY